MKDEIDLNLLNGQKGLIYFLMVKRKLTGKLLAEELQNSILIQDAEPRIYAIINELEKNRFITQVERRGKEKIRTANLEPLKQFYLKTKTEYSEDILSIVARYSSYFIKYLSIGFQASGIKSVKSMDHLWLFEKYINFQRSLMNIALSKEFEVLEFDLVGMLRLAAPLLKDINYELFVSETDMMAEINKLLTDDEQQKLKEHYLNYVWTPEMREAYTTAITELKKADLIEN